MTIRSTSQLLATKCATAIINRYPNFKNHHYARPWIQTISQLFTSKPADVAMAVANPETAFLRKLGPLPSLHEVRKACEQAEVELRQKLPP